MQLAFDIRKLQRSAREKLVPAERLEQKRQAERQVGTNGTVPDLRRRLFSTLTPQERVIYERVSQHPFLIIFLDAYFFDYSWLKD